MTQIEFHFNATDKLAYVSRLLRKGAAQGTRLFVLAEDADLKRLDAALWALSPHDFVSHCMGIDDPIAAQNSSIILSSQLVPVPGVQVGVHLGADVPDDFTLFDRWIEVVSDDPSDRAEARARWKQYTAMGYTLIRKDLNLKSPN